LKIVIAIFFSFINMSATVCKILVLEGGGSHGAIQGGIIESLLETKYYSSPNPYNILSGISAGSLNAATLSYYKDQFPLGISTLKQIWVNSSNSNLFN